MKDCTVIKVAADAGDYDDYSGEPTGTVDLGLLASDLGSLHDSLRTEDISALLEDATCDGSCDSEQFSTEIAAQSSLGALADEIGSIADRLNALRVALEVGAR